MTALVLLNGPPGVGKSTIARRLVADHPLALALDIDVVRSMLGRWLDTPTDAGLAARSLAVAMIRTHLAAGHDVVVPQFLGRVDFVVELAGVASAAGAAFVELALTARRDEAVAWLAERSARPVTAVDRENAALLERGGGDPGAMYDGFRSVVAARPRTIEVPVVRGDVEGTHRAVVAAVRSAGWSPT